MLRSTKHEVSASTSTQSNSVVPHTTSTTSTMDKAATSLRGNHRSLSGGAYGNYGHPYSPYTRGGTSSEVAQTRTWIADPEGQDSCWMPRGPFSPGPPVTTGTVTVSTPNFTQSFKQPGDFTMSRILQPQIETTNSERMEQREKMGFKEEAKHLAADKRTKQPLFKQLWTPWNRQQTLPDTVQSYLDMCSDSSSDENTESKLLIIAL